MDYQIIKNNQDLELAKSHLYLWFSELNIQNITLSFAGYNENKYQEAIFLKDCLGNQFGIIFHGILNYGYAQLSLQTATYSKTFTEIEKPQEQLENSSLCFFIHDSINQEILGYVKYILIKKNNTIPLPYTEPAKANMSCVYRLFCYCDSIEENFSILNFFLENFSNTDCIQKIFKTGLLALNNNFYLLLKGKDVSKIIPKKIRLELGEISISDSDMYQLTAGNILELSNIEDITAKVIIGEKEVASATFKYESGKIQLKILSAFSNNEKKIKKEELFSRNLRFIRSFFDESNSTKLI